MQKYHEKEVPYLLTIEQAGFDILYAIMLADGHADEKEFELIKDYLKKETIQRSSLFNEDHSFYSEINFNKEYSYLKSLDRKSLFARFKNAVSSIQEWLKGKEEGAGFKKDVLQFAHKIAHADGILKEEEIELIKILENIWGI